MGIRMKSTKWLPAPIRPTPRTPVTTKDSTALVITIRWLDKTIVLTTYRDESSIQLPSPVF
jgi:hypothetical protein